MRQISRPSRRVDDEAVAHVAVDDAIVCLVDPVGADRLDLCADAVLGAEVEHLLGRGDPADHRPGQRAPIVQQRECLELQGMFGQSEFDEGAVDREQREVLVEVEVHRHRVQDQIELVAQRAEGRLVTGRVIVICTEPLAVLLFSHRLAEHGHLGAEGVGDLDAHVPEPAHADDGDLLARPGAPMLQRRVQRDARTQKGVATSSSRPSGIRSTKSRSPRPAVNSAVGEFAS